MKEFYQSSAKGEGDIYDLIVFTQAWPSSSLGFGGFGGQVLRMAVTTCVFHLDVYVGVFFGGCFAYRKEKDSVIMQDIVNGSMVDAPRSSSTTRRELWQFAMMKIWGRVLSLCAKPEEKKVFLDSASVVKKLSVLEDTERV